MAAYDLRKASKISSGQRSVPIGVDNTNLEKRVYNIEDKLNTLLNLVLELKQQKIKQQKNND